MLKQESEAIRKETFSKCKTTFQNIKCGNRNKNLMESQEDKI